MVSLGDTAISLHILQKVGGGYSPDQLKLKVPRSAQIFISGGGGTLWDFLAQNLPCHFLEALASQIVSHILRMWRLMTNCIHLLQLYDQLERKFGKYTLWPY